MHKYFYTRGFRYYSLPRKIDFLKRKFGLFIIFTFVYMFISIILTFGLIHQKEKYENILIPQPKNLTIDLTDLNPSQTKKIQNILNDVNPIYLTLVKSITIKQDISSDYPSKERWNNLTVGFNTDDHIFIAYEDGEKQMREYLCHELLHSYMLHSNETHVVVYDLGEKMVCFK